MFVNLQKIPKQIFFRLTIQRGLEENGIWFRTPLGVKSSDGLQENCITYPITSFHLLLKIGRLFFFM